MKTTVAGAGLVGSLLSIYLAKRGHNVTVYERRPDMRDTSIPAGRSINLAMSDRGLRGLAGVGLEEEIRKICIPMHGRMIHDVQGNTNFQRYGKEGQFINSVSRGELNKLLMTEAEKAGVKIHFNSRLASLDLNTATAKFIDANNNEIVAQADTLLGTDGAFSAARMALMTGSDRFDYSQTYLEHGYKELTILPVNGEFALDQTALHIWPRGGYMLIALPNLDKTFTCTLFFPFEGEDSFATYNTVVKGREFFERIFPDALALMPEFDEEWAGNPVSSLVTVRCLPWKYKDKLLLVGDAAHAIVPFYGQGMNCGFEDCTVLDQLLGAHNDLTTVFTEFEKLRKPNADAVAELALMNFVEMRDKVADPMFVLRKKIEAKFNAKHPTLWLPLYSMVTFSDIPYAEALTLGQWQNSIMEKVMAQPNITERWDSLEVEEYMHSLVKEFSL
ncbi:MAG: FAD-dependent monooxygenase [Sphingobacteriales bacterium JAD_PAG50586_3]|nr:MAG: FAD-dependent monooxygenase [Sphingobacteriales bacterium JAD_PAG50586_3]